MFQAGNAEAHTPFAIPETNSTAAEEVSRGNAAFVAGDLSAAQRHYLIALQRHPDAPQLHCRAAYAFWHSGDSQRAKQLFQRAMELDPHSAEAHEAMGQLYIEQGRIEQAL